MVNPYNAEALSSKLQGYKNFRKLAKPCHVGIHWIALAEYFQMSTHMPGFQSFSGFLHLFVLAKLATSSIRVKGKRCCNCADCTFSPSAVSVPGWWRGSSAQGVGWKSGSGAAMSWYGCCGLCRTPYRGCLPVLPNLKQDNGVIVVLQL